MGQTRPLAYVGNKPHAFISYAHKDRNLVYPIIEKLQRLGVRVWYDEGLEVGDHWDESIAQNILKCDCVICFITENFINSENCKNEIHMAASENRGPLITYLDFVELPPEMRLQYGRRHALALPNYDSIDSFVRHIAESEILKNCREQSGAYTGSRPSPTAPSKEIREPDFTPTSSTSVSHSPSSNSGTGKQSYFDLDDSDFGPAPKSSNSQSSSYSNYKSDPVSVSPDFFEIALWIIMIGALIGSVACLFLASRQGAIASLVCLGIAIVFAIFVGIAHSWGLDNISSSGFSIFFWPAAVLIALAVLFVGLYQLFDIYGTKDWVIDEQTLVSCFVNEEAIEIPDGIVEIKGDAFSGQLGLRSKKIEVIILPDSVETICNSAFSNCQSVKEIYLGSNIESIGAWAFSGCYSLETIYFRGTQEQWNAIDKSEGFLRKWNFEIEECQIICLGE